MRLVRKRFRAWLERKPGEEVVGVARDSCDCPMARFLVSEGYTAPDITDDYIAAETATGRDVEGMPPRWAARFISEVDDEENGTPVTAGQALELLR